MNKRIRMSGENMENSVDPNISDKVVVSRYTGRMRVLNCQTALIGNLSLGVARTMAFELASQESTFQLSGPA